MKVLVLGHNGMLGHMVCRYLHENDIEVVVHKVKWPLNQKAITDFDGDYIINCIGAIPQKTNDFHINWKLPIWLDMYAPCRIVHPGTDCEGDDNEYGKSKAVAAEYIRTNSKQTKSLKSSVIGPELKSKAGLFEWFMSQEGEVDGYSGAFWNGITTLEWSKQCLGLIRNWESPKYLNETIIYSSPCSKYELLHVIKIVFDKDIKINEKKIGKYKCLEGLINTGNIYDQLKELKEYYY